MLAVIGNKNIRNAKIIKRKEQLQAKLAKKLEYNQEIATDNLLTDYKYLEGKAKEGDSVAIGARTAISRELDNITGLQGQSVTIKSEIPTDPKAKLSWLKDEIARLEGNMGIIEAYNQADNAIASRY